MRFLITGSAGFIGFHLARRLLADGHTVVGFDGMTDPRDAALKAERHEILRRVDRFRAVEARLEDIAALTEAAAEAQVIVHLAARAGGPASLEDLRAYVDSNLIGTFNLLEVARTVRPRHLLLASTSAVYDGAAVTGPFLEGAPTDLPVSLYAATKKATEALSHSHAHLFGIPTTCLRFFTVYGPRAGPDSALLRLVDAVLAGRPIAVSGKGELRRDVLYVDDLVEAIVRLIGRPPVAGVPVEAEGVVDTLSPSAPWRVVNIAGDTAIRLAEVFAAIEALLGRRLEKRLRHLASTPIDETCTDGRLLEALTGYRPSTPVEVGIPEFVGWYLGHRRCG
jgi:UDP-glucuronate 4-epimerase